MRFRMLGSFEVERDGRTVALGPPRQRTLLALLLLHRNQVVTVDLLVDELWAGRPPKTAAQIVRVYVSQLRKELGGDALETAGHGYMLRTGPDAVDADRFERLAAEGGRRLEAGDPAWRGDTARGAGTVARNAARRPCGRALRAAGDRPPRGAPPLHPRGSA